MKVALNVGIALLLAFVLTGCFGEDYDVGVPSASLVVGTASFPLKEGNVQWKTESEDVEKTVANSEKTAIKLKKLTVTPGQKASLAFEENEKNGGDIWTDPTISAQLLKDGKPTKLKLNDEREFTFPTTKGNYALIVEFSSSPGDAEYLGSIVIK